jgi:hypothetical protein
MLSRSFSRSGGPVGEERRTPWLLILLLLALILACAVLVLSGC